MIGDRRGAGFSKLAPAGKERNMYNNGYNGWPQYPYCGQLQTNDNRQVCTVPEVIDIESARKYPLAPNSSIIAVSSSAEGHAYLITSDASGSISVKEYIMEEYKAPDPMDAMNERIARLENLIINKLGGAENVNTQ